MTVRIAFAAGACLLVVLALAWVAYVIGPRGWDDGAITVAFARTFALTGDFALTTISERVEGFSSLLYMGLLSLLIPTAAEQMDVQILISQMLTVASLVGAGIMLFTALDRAVPSVAARLFIVALFLAFPLHFRETMNGMEMALLGLLFISWVWAADTGRAGLEFMLVPLILLTRFESIFYLGVVYGALFVTQSNRRYHFFSRGVVVIFFFSLITLVRWIWLQDFMPNPIWAKLQPPYSVDSTLLAEVRSKLFGLQAFFTILGPLLLAGLFFLLFRPSAWIFETYAFWLVVAFLLFTLFTGRSSGYDGRMFLGLLPVLVFLVADIVARSSRREGSDHAPFLVLSAALAIVLLVNIGELKNTSLLVLKRLDELGRLPTPVSRTIAGPISRAGFPANPAVYAANGHIADEVRQLIDQEQIVLMAPDIGGLGLCCAPGTLEVIDNALLANRRLAKEGYSEFRTLLVERRPELILTHFIWASYSGIYKLDFFSENYRPMILRNTLFWVRADIHDRVLAEGASIAGIAGPEEMAGLHNDLREPDLEYLSAGTPHPLVKIVMP